MRKEVIVLFTLMLACTPVCDEKITCEDGRTLPAEQLIKDTCISVD